MDFLVTRFAHSSHKRWFSNSRIWSLTQFRKVLKTRTKYTGAFVTCSSVSSQWESSRYTEMGGASKMSHGRISYTKIRRFFCQCFSSVQCDFSFQRWLSRVANVSDDTYSTLERLQAISLTFVVATSTKRIKVVKDKINMEWGSGTNSSNQTSSQNNAASEASSDGKQTNCLIRIYF